MLKLAGCQVCGPVLTAFALALATVTCVSAGETASAKVCVELTHPQSADNGHYVAFRHRAEVAVCGLVAVNGGVHRLRVNGRRAELHPTHIKPAGSPQDAVAVEFRATVPVKPATKLNIVVKTRAGERATASFLPDSETTILRLRALVSEAPNEARPCHRLGCALRDHDELEAAVAEFREALELGPMDCRTRCELGNALIALGDEDGAIAELRKATEIAPASPMTWLYLGFAQLKVARCRGEAAESFARYLKLEPEGRVADFARRLVSAAPTGDRPAQRGG